MVDEAEGRINYHLIEIESELFNCFNRIPTKIYFKLRFSIISRRIIKLYALKISLGLNWHLKLKLYMSAHHFFQ